MNTMTKRSQKREMWTNIVLCAMIFFFCFGFFSSNKSLYLKAITDALDMPRTAYSAATSFRFVATAVISMFFGVLRQKFGAKKLLLAGIFLLTCSVLLNSVANAVWMFCLSELIAGIGFSWVGTPMVSSILNRCCQKNVGTVMGSVMAANGVGGALAAQIVTPIIYAEGNPFGYRNAYRLVACFLIAIALLFLFFFKERKEEATAKPAAVPHKKLRGESWVGITFGEAAKTAYFYGAAVCIFLCGLCLHGISNIAATHMLDVGIDAAVVATVSSVSSLLLTGSKFLTGFLYDKLGLRGAISICCTAAVISMLLLSTITDSQAGVISVFVYAPLAAIALPLETVMIPLYAKDLFGDKSYDRVMGIFYSINTFGYAVGGPLVNAGYDLWGDYRVMLRVTGFVMLTALIVLQFVITAAHRRRERVLQST